jgi:hypothetical protein
VAALQRDESVDNSLAFRRGDDGVQERREVKRRWPNLLPPEDLVPRFEVLELKRLREQLFILDTAMLAWLESLHRHPHIDDAWLQAVAELDPLAWWGSWSDGEARR